MKIASPLSSAAVVFSAVFFSIAVAQQPPAPAAGAHPHPPAPAPTNLQVLPKTLTGEQVHEIMHKWEAELGTECSTCHATDPNRKLPNGRPALNFADDSKEEKKTARLMVNMVEEINTQYVGKIDSSGLPVSCGTCHRGHLDPQAYVPPPDHDHDHPAPGAPTAPAAPSSLSGTPK